MPACTITVEPSSSQAVTPRSGFIAVCAPLFTVFALFMSPFCQSVVQKSRVRFFAVLLIFFSSFSPYILAYEYIGCFSDRLNAADRALSGALFLEDGQRPELCEETCVDHAFNFFGLQYGNECWCGSQTDTPEEGYAKYGAVDESKCSYPCAGDAAQKCGGELVNSVFKVTKQSSKAKSLADDDRPLLALVMIVKDEAHTLPNTLQAIKAYIDYYYILDTGSSDGTQDAIRKTLGADKGEVHEEPFVDYGTSRNRVLEIAQKSEHTGKQPVFLLMLSADETVYNAASLRKFCEEHRNSDGPMHEAYAIVMDAGWRFDSLRLSRASKGWRYVGKVHEYLAAPDKKWHPTMRVPDSYIKFRVTDPERRSKREMIIRDILEKEIRENPGDARSSFYLARTYNVLQNHTAALAEFRRRISLGGWSEEVYESYYAVAWQLDALKAPWSEIQQAFLDAYEHSPERAEPLYAVASHWYKDSKYSLAYLFASAAINIPYPKNAVLWVQAAVYQWQAHFLVGMTGLKLKKVDEGALSILIVAQHKGDDELVKQQIAKYEQEINDQHKWNELLCKAHHPNCPSATVEDGSHGKSLEHKSAGVGHNEADKSNSVFEGVAGDDDILISAKKVEKLASGSPPSSTSLFIVGLLMLAFGGAFVLLLSCMLKQSKTRKGKGGRYDDSDKVV